MSNLNSYKPQFESHNNNPRFFMFPKMKSNPLQFFFFLAILLFFQSCETHPPEINLGDEFGYIDVSSDMDLQIDTIKIFVDDKFSEKFSPAKLRVEAGNHTVYLKYGEIRTVAQSVFVQKGLTENLHFTFRNQSEKKVLLEDFANVSCDPCVISSEIIHNMLTWDFSDGNLVVLRYATNFPSPNDPFYLANPTIFDSRISFYNILFAPTTIIDGTERPISTDSIDIALAIENQLQRESNFNITISNNFTGDSLFISVTLDYPVDTPTENLALFTVLIKKEVIYTEPPGSNGETDFENVVVEIIPSAEGENIGEEKTFNYSKANNYGLTEDNFSVVSFIQNKITKEILQTNIN